MKNVTLILSDGTKFHGQSFGYDAPVAGEVVFNTAMMGYPESLTDPSYAGQILTFTYPLIGNYGVPPFTFEKNGLPTFMESDKIYVAAMICADYSEQFSHWNGVETLASWLKREHIPGITGIDTRQLTKVLREHGVMMGSIVFDDEPENIPHADYSGVNFVDKVSCKDIIRYNEGAGKKVVLVDCGVKANIIRCLINRGVEVIRVPWNYDYTDMEFDGLFLANGPGDPDTCQAAVDVLKKQLSSSRKPVCGICMGNQLLGKAARCHDLQAQIWSPFSQPAGASCGHEPLLHHFSEPRLCCRRIDARLRLGGALRQYERWFQRGYPSQDQSLVLLTVPS